MECNSSNPLREHGNRGMKMLINLNPSYLAKRHRQDSLINSFWSLLHILMAPLFTKGQGRVAREGMKIFLGNGFIIHLSKINFVAQSDGIIIFVISIL